MKKLFLRDQRGFTLIELLIVIAIIAILASIAIPQYMKYQKKAKVSSYAEPIVRACLMDLAAYCVENPPLSGTQDLTVSTTYGKNCISTQRTPGGDVELGGGPLICDNTGSLTSGFVTGLLAGATDYTAECSVAAGGFKCTVK